MSVVERAASGGWVWRMVLAVSIAGSAVGLCRPATAWAQPGDQTQSADEVELQDGSVVRGRIKESRPGSHVIIVAQDGSEQTFSWSAVRAVRQNVQVATTDPDATSEPPPAPVEEPSDPPPPAESAPPPEVDSSAAAGGLVVKRRPGVRRSRSLYMTRDEIQAHLESDCGDEDHECRRRAHAEATRQGHAMAQYDWKRDCATAETQYCQRQGRIMANSAGQFEAEAEVERDCTNSNADYCREKAGIRASNEGLVVGYQRESVSSVDKVRSTAIAGALSLGGMAGMASSESADMTMGGGTIDAGAKILVGSRFPGATGGMWYGAFLEPSLGAFVMSVSTKTHTDTPAGMEGYDIDTGSGSTSMTSAMVRVAASGGVQLLRYSPLKADHPKLKQNGLGLALGGLVGYAADPDTGDGSETYGPVIGIQMPARNPGTSRYQALDIKFMYLPMPAMNLHLFFFNAGFLFG